MTVLAVALAGVAGAVTVLAVLGYPLVWPLRKRPRRRGLLDGAQQWLQQAGAPVSVVQYAAVSAAIGVLTAGVVVALTGVVAVGLVPALIVMMLPHLYWANRRRQHLSEVRQAWPDGLYDLAASVRARMPLQSAVTDLATYGPAPLRTALANYPALVSQLRLVPALEHVRESLADPTSDRVFELLVMGATYRPDRLADMLTELARSITADLRLEEELRTSKIEPQITAAIVGAAPWVIVIVMMMWVPQLRDYYQSGQGTGIVAVAAAMTITGIVVVVGLNRSAPEPRVFGAKAQS